MATTTASSPGLEVVNPDSSGLQVVEWYNNDKNPHPPLMDGYKGYPHASGQPIDDGLHHLAGPEPAAPVSSRRRKRWWIVAGAILAVVAIVGAVVGALFGTGVIGSGGSSGGEGSSEGGSGGDGSSTGTSSPTSSAAAPSGTSSSNSGNTSIRQGSPLSVTGWRTTVGTELFLFYMDDDDQMHYSRYDSSRSDSDDRWDEPAEMKSFTDSRTMLSASTIVYSQQAKPQVQVYYTGSDDRLLGANYNPDRDPLIIEDSLNGELLKRHADSRVSTYWPWVTFQDEDGDLVEVRSKLGGNWAPSASWDVRKLPNLQPLEGTSVAVVPLNVMYRLIAVGGGYGVVFQDKDGKMGFEIPRLDEEDSLPEDYALSWPEDYPDIAFPANNPIAAFTVARPADESGRVNTYILYLDGNANINVVYADSSASWKTSSPRVMRDVDEDTDIACFTPPATHVNQFNDQVNLAESSSDTRCYFQRGGKLREVVMTGTEWIATGEIPIP